MSVPIGPVDPILLPAEVHVWTANLAALPPGQESFDRWLGPDERNKAAAFHSDRHRFRYQFAHVVLRDILARYLATDPAQIQFRENSFGKPFLAVPEASGLEFNLSHSGEVAMLAVALRRHIGLDVELLRPLGDLEAMANGNFAPPERALVAAAGPAERLRTFFTCWTRKEAFIKAIGMGLSVPLNIFDTSIPTGASGLRLEALAEGPKAESWWLSDLDAPDGYVAAMAIESGFDDLRYWRWSPDARFCLTS